MGTDVVSVMAAYRDLPCVCVVHCAKRLPNFMLEAKVGDCTPVYFDSNFGKKADI